MSESAVRSLKQAIRLQKQQGLQPTDVTYCGVHFTTCPVEVREAWTRAGTPENIKQLKSSIGLSQVEIVAISTCNRFDVCALGKVSSADMVRFFSELLKKDPQKSIHTSHISDIKGLLRMAQGTEALRLLFRVAASLDSLVLGEPHILGQIKEAYLASQTEGLCGRHAALLFNRLFNVTKKIRTETGLGAKGVSVGHAAVELVKSVFPSLADKRVCILGAGEMARLALQHFASHGAGRITLANRTFAKAQALVQEVGHGKAMSLDEVLKSTHEFDAFVVAVGGNDVILKSEHFRRNLRLRPAHTVVVDISIPLKVEKAVGDAEGVFLFDIDDLTKIMEKNRSERRAAAQDAEESILKEVDQWVLDAQSRKGLDDIAHFHNWIQETVQAEVKKSLQRQLNGHPLDPEILTGAIAKKLTGRVVQLMRTHNGTELGDTVGHMLQTLFLSEGPLEAPPPSQPPSAFIEPINPRGRP